MNTNALPRGLHIMSADKWPWRHKFLVDVGNTIGARDFGAIAARTIEHGPDGFRSVPLDPRPGLAFERTVADTPAAVRRFWEWKANGDKEYRPDNNCEHVTYGIADGEPRSPQLWKTLFVVGILGLGIWAVARSRSN